MKKKKQTLMQVIGNKFWMWKIHLMYRHSLKVEKQIRMTHCAKGFHKLSHCTWEFHSPKEHKRVEYLSCVFCKYTFFATMKDKETYMEMHKHDDQSMQRMMDAMLRTTPRPPASVTFTKTTKTKAKR